MAEQIPTGTRISMGLTTRISMGLTTHVQSRMGQLIKQIQRNAVEIHYQKIIYALCSPIPGAARTRPKDALTSTM